MDPTASRRRYLGLLAASAVTAVAGCSNGETTDEQNDGDQPEETPGSDDSTPNGDTPGDTDGTPTEKNVNAGSGGRLNVSNAVGTDLDGGAVGVVEMTVHPVPGSGSIDLSEITVQWVDGDGSDTLTDADFQVTTIRDDNDSLSGATPVLDDRVDRAILVFDLSTFKESGLAEGTEATIKFTTASSATTIETITVPDSLAGEDAVRL